MHKEIDNLVLEHLRSLHNEPYRVSARVAFMADQLAGIRANIARLDHRLDGVDKRVESIERRLTLAESPD